MAVIPKNLGDTGAGLMRATGARGNTASGTVKVLGGIRDIEVDMFADLAALRVAAAGTIVGTVVNDFANLTDTNGVSLDVIVTGAQLGDFAIATLGADVIGITVTAVVKSADIVTVHLQNESGGAVDIPSTTVKVILVPAAQSQLFGLVGSSACDP